MVAERRKLIKPAQSAAFLAELNQLPIQVASDDSARAFGEVIEVARRLRLSAASYLDLAMRRSLALATVDASMRHAARATGVSLA